MAKQCYFWTFVASFLLVFLNLKTEANDDTKTGTVRGVVRFTGNVPTDQTITTSDGGTIKHNDLVVDAKSKGLRYVLAVLEDAPVQPCPANAKTVSVDQVDWVFKPRVVAVQEGQAVRFDNNDQFNHSVNAVSLVKENQLNAVAGPGTPIIHRFVPQKNPVLIGCSLHPWMRAWVYVVRHPWFSLSDEQGKFEIGNIPPGNYTLLLHHVDTNSRERKSVEVIAGKVMELTFTWEKVEGK
jgi:plastocyanin